MEGDTAIIVIQPINDEDLYKLECIECKRLVQLPVFQIHLFLTKGYRKFVCANCIDIPKYLLDIVPKVQVPIPSHTKTMAELTAALQQNAKENDKHKVNNIALTNIQKQLREELSKQVELSKNERRDIQAAIRDYRVGKLYEVV